MKTVGTDSETLGNINRIIELANQNRDDNKSEEHDDKISTEQEIIAPKMREISNDQQSLIFDSSDPLFPSEIIMNFGRGTRVDITKGKRKISILQIGEMTSQDQKLEMISSKSRSEYVISSKSEKSNFKVYIKKKRV